MAIRDWTYIAQQFDVTYRFNTSVMKSIQGEQRQAKRSQPHVTYEVSFQMSDTELAAARTTLRDQIVDATDANLLNMPRWDYAASALVADAGGKVHGYDIFLRGYLLQSDNWFWGNDYSDGVIFPGSSGEAAVVDEEYFFNSASYETSGYPTNLIGGAPLTGEGDIGSLDAGVLSGGDNLDILVDAGSELTAQDGLWGLLAPVEVVRIVSPPQITRVGYNNNLVSMVVTPVAWELPAVVGEFSFDVDGRPQIDNLPEYSAGFSEAIEFNDVSLDFLTGPVTYNRVRVGLDNLFNRGYRYRNHREKVYYEDLIFWAQGQLKTFNTYYDATSVSYSYFRLNSDQITFRNEPNKQGSVELPMKLLEDASEI